MNEFLEALQDPHARHAIMIHFPIVLSVVGLAPLAALALGRFRSATLKWVCIGCYAMASLGAALAANAGEAAHDELHDIAPALSDAEHEAVEEHEELGENGWIWPLIPAAMIGLSFLRKKHAAVLFGSLGIAGGLGATGWVAFTAREGGRLVYVYGLGVPARGASENADATTDAAPDDDSGEATGSHHDTDHDDDD